MPFSIDPKIAPYYDLTFAFGAFILCKDCHRQLEYTSTYPRYTDEDYYDAAVAMHAACWRVIPEAIDAFCAVCAGR